MVARSRLVRWRTRIAVLSVVAIFTLVAAVCCAAGNQRTIAELHHSSWTSRDGAPIDVNMMAQTEDGFLWLATGSGLVRFDGAQFERYTPAPGETLPSGSVYSLLTLPGNGLLVGWTLGGATLLRDGHVTHFGEQEGYPPGSTYQFLLDHSGIVWAATSSGLARLERNHWQRIGAEWNVAGQRALSLFQGRDDTIALFTDKTLMLLPGGAKTFRATGGTTTSRRPIVQAPDGSLYVSDRRGIRQIESLADYERGDRTLMTRSYDDSGDPYLVVDRAGGLWFGTLRGLGHIPNPDAHDERLDYFSKAEGLTDAAVRAIFEDRDGNIWTATAGGLDQFRVASFVAPVELLQAPVSVAYPALLPGTEGGAWFAGFWGGLRYLSSDGTVSKVMEDIHVTVAYRDPQGVDWYGSQPRAPAIAELVRREGDRVQHIPLPPDVPPEVDVQAITRDNSGTLWVSVVRRGVYRFANNAWTQATELPDAGKLAALAMRTDSLGRVWLGYTDNRLARWDRGTVRVFSAPEGLDVGNVLTISEKGHHIWIGGDRGLALFDSDRLRPMMTTDSSVLRGISGLVESANGDLWIHGTAGAVLVPATEVHQAIGSSHYAMTRRLFDDDDGLYGAPTNLRPMPTLVEGTDGRLWFSTNRGVFSLDPRAIITNLTPPTVVLKDVWSGSTRYTAHSDITLTPRSTSVRFDYTATALTIGRRARFRYRLSGVDDVWQDADDRRQAFYTNLGPGHYRFQVIASNENGVWNQPGASVDLTITPAWYQTGVFRTLCVIAAIAVLLLLFRLRLTQMRNQLQARLQERLLERERIARELHDTLIQGFQGLILLFGAVAQRIPEEHPSRELLGKALKSADRVLAEGRDRVRGLRESISLNHDLPTALKEVAEDLALAQPIEFAVSVSGMQRPLHSVVMEDVYQIAREALANAHRHAGANRIELELLFAPSQLRVLVRDDGRGIDDGILRDGGLPGHWGMSGMRERAKKLGATLHLRSGPQSGTEVDLQVPGAVAYRNDANGQRWWHRFLRRLRGDGYEHQ